MIPLQTSRRQAQTPPRATSFWTSFLLLTALLAAAPAPAQTVAPMGLLVPAYQYPTLGDLWARIANVPSRVPLIAIANPGSGPGLGVDPNYTGVINATRAAGHRVIGYVATSYADKPVDSVLVEVARWRAFYAIDGIFLDEMANDLSTAHLDYYARLYTAIRTPNSAWIVVGNPGVATQPEYLEAPSADIVCDFEHHAGYESWTPPPWRTGQPPTRFLHLLYARRTAASMRASLALIAQRNTAWAYVVHDSLDNPWDETPPYWDAMVAAVDSLRVPIPLAAPLPHGPVASLRAWPVPARGLVRFERRPGPEATLEVLDVAGRVVRELAYGAGASEVAWDGLDARGRATPPGLYFARLRGGLAPAFTRVLRIE